LNSLDINKLIKASKSYESNSYSKRLSILGDYSTQHLKMALQGFFAITNTNIEVIDSDYNQIFISINDPNSLIYKHRSDYVIIFETTEKLENSFFNLSEDEKALFADKKLLEIESLLTTLSKNLPKSKIIINDFLEYGHNVFGNYGYTNPCAFQYQIRKLNCLLIELVSKKGNVFLNNINHVALALGQEKFISRSFYFSADMSFSLDTTAILAKNIGQIINSCEGRFKKCVIIDLDNTLWGGVIGDDGIEHIEIGDLGNGKVFTAFQKWLLELKKRGIILCICSKNNESTAKEPFKRHPEMVLRLNDIAVFVANWKNKADNIRFIQSILNISFDSMVFLDDNPFERNQVRIEIPEISVPELPETPEHYIEYLDKLNLFETSSFSPSDKDRTKQYQEESLRAENKVNYSSINDYLRSLEMKAELKPFDNLNKARIAQLTQRSNQFNLRTIRYTEKDIEDIINSKSKYGFYVKIKDKYGDYGLISAVVLDDHIEHLFIDTWIMSCRVLKRNVENIVINSMVEFAKQKSKKALIGEYIPTKKNALVEMHYKSLGFDKKNKYWILDLKKHKSKTHFFKINQ